MADLSNKIISSNFQRLLQVSESNAVADGTGSLSALSLDMSESGKVGIGTLTPTKKLDVVGTMNISGSEFFPTSGSTPDEIVAIVSSGSIIPAAPEGDFTGSYDLGSVTKPWRDLYLYSGSLKMVGDPEGVVTFTANDFLNLKKGRPITNRLDGTRKIGILDAARISALTDGTTEDDDTFIQLSTADRVRIVAGGIELLDFQQDTPEFTIGDLSDTYPLNIKTQLSASRDIYASGSVDVLTNLVVRGDTEVRGDVTLGNSGSDTLIVHARVSSSIVPTTSDTFTLGSLLTRWRSLFVKEIGNSNPVESFFVGDLKINDTRIQNVNNDVVLLNPVNGNVGIGLTNPSEKLHVQGNISASGTVFADSFQSATGGSGIDFNDSLDLAGNITASGNISASGNLETSKLTIVKTNATSDEKLISLKGPGGVERFSVDEDGDVSATSLLSTGNIVIGSTAATGFTFSQGGAGALTLHQSDDTDVSFLTIDSGDVRLRTENFNNAVFVDNSTQRVGIGTAVPSKTLQVIGDIATSGNISASGTAHTLNGTLTTNTIASSFNVNTGISLGVSLQRISSDGKFTDFETSGRVIFPGDITASGDFFTHGNITSSGDISASGDLYVNKISGSTTLEEDNNGGDTSFTIRNRASLGSTDETVSLKFGHLVGGAGGKIVSGRDNNYNIGAAQESNLQFYVSKTGSDTERMRINSNGNVGIGTATPPRKLTIEGDISASDAIMGITHITASGTITTTGGDLSVETGQLILGSNTVIKVGGNNRLDLSSTAITAMNNTPISASKLIVDSHITASGNITSSGNILTTGNITSSGGLQINGSDINFNNLPVSQSGLTSGQLYTMSGSQLPFSASASELNVISSQKFVLIA